MSRWQCPRCDKVVEVMYGAAAVMCDCSLSPKHAYTHMRRIA